MMNHFRVCYIPGGMSINHSAWFLCERQLVSGVYRDIPIKYLRKSDYK
jgi:hypothetical protein